MLHTTNPWTRTGTPPRSVYAVHTEKVDTIIIGGGLSGIYAAFLLAAKKKSAGKTSICDGAFHFAGTETADHLRGYLEGALSSAERAVSAVI